VKTRSGVVAALLMVVGLGLSGCGKAEQAMEKLDAKQAAAWIDEAGAVQVTVSLDADPAALKAFADSDPAFTAEDQEAVELLSDAKIIAVGNTDDAAGLGSVTVQLGGKDALSVVGGGDDLYLKIDASALPKSTTSSLGADPTQLAGMLDLFAPGAGDALRNKWVHIDADQLAALAGEGSPSAKQTPDAKTVEQMTDALKDLLSKATIVDDPNDPTHKVVTVKSADIEAAMTKFHSLDKGGMASKYLLEDKVDTTDLPETITVDAYVTDGDLTRLSIDLTQFDKADKAAGPVRLDLAFAEAAPVVAPTGAKDLDITKLARGLLGQFSEKLGG
jgi:hypothetical protein